MPFDVWYVFVVAKVKLSGIMPGTGTALEVQVRGMDKVNGVEDTFRRYTRALY